MNEEPKKRSKRNKFTTVSIPTPLLWEPFSKEDEKRIKARLRALGYID